MPFILRFVVLCTLMLTACGTSGGAEEEFTESATSIYQRPPCSNGYEAVPTLDSPDASVSPVCVQTTDKGFLEVSLRPLMEALRQYKAWGIPYTFWPRVNFRVENHENANANAFAYPSGLNACTVCKTPRFEKVPLPAYWDLGRLDALLVIVPTTFMGIVTHDLHLATLMACVEAGALILVSGIEKTKLMSQNARDNYDKEVTTWIHELAHVLDFRLFDFLERRTDSISLPFSDRHPLSEAFGRCFHKDRREAYSPNVGFTGADLRYSNPRVQTRVRYDPRGSLDTRAEAKIDRLGPTEDYAYTAGASRPVTSEVSPDRKEWLARTLSVIGREWSAWVDESGQVDGLRVVPAIVRVLNIVASRSFCETPADIPFP